MLKKTIAKLKPVKKQPKTKKVATKTEGPRRLKQRTYKSFKLSKKIKPVQPPLKSSYKIFKLSLKTFFSNKKVLIGLSLVYGLLTLILVNGFGNSLNAGELKEAFSDLSDGQLGDLTVSATIFGALVTSTGSAVTATGSVYQTVLLVIFALATIWCLRQVYAGQSASVKDGLYKGMTPLIPFLLVLVVIGLQLLPLAIGGWLYGIVISNNIAITFVEKAIWGLLFGSMVILSLYMISSSIFGLFVVALPDMKPMKALRSARGLVLHRRLMVIKRLLFLPVILVLIAAVIMIPVLLWLTAIADWLFFGLSQLGAIFSLTYLYALYRELLNE